MNNQKSLEVHFIAPMTQIMKDSYMNFEHLFESLKKTCSDAEQCYIDLIDQQVQYYKMNEKALKLEKELQIKLAQVD